QHPADRLDSGHCLYIAKRLHMGKDSRPRLIGRDQGKELRHGSLPLDWGYQLITRRGRTAPGLFFMVLPGDTTPKFPFTRKYLKYTLWMGLEDYRTSKQLDARGWPGMSDYVLIVDDDPDVRMIMHTALSLFG